jgi:hypothetical protein
VPDVRFTTVNTAIDALYGWYATNRGAIDRSALLSDR